MNSSCRRLLRLGAVLCGLAAATDAAATQLAAVYSTACRRDIGVILHADETRIQLLTLDGEIRAHRRFEIIYLAYYSVGTLPIPGVRNPGAVDTIAVKTREGGAVVELARGWLADHSDVEMSFLGLDGQEAVIRIDDIWDLEQGPQQEPVTFAARTAHYSFAHPYPFRFCAEESDVMAELAPAGAEPPRTIYPQQLLSDPLIIKAELDRIQAGHEKLDGFAESKRFYAVPQVYRNDTWLGLWLNGGARHGASRTRTNSLTPLLVSELSEGPFSFQRVWVAGAAPMPFSVHEEVQTQLYYRLKADYVHFSANYDVSRPLIGENRYRWHPSELGSRDERWNEVFHVGGGFDYRAFAIDLAITTVEYALSDEPRFFREQAEMTKGGLLYQDDRFEAQFYYGLAHDGKPELEEVAEGSSDEDIGEAEDKLKKIPDFSTVLKLYRLNLSLTGTGPNRFDFSLIQRQVKLHRLAGDDGTGEFRYRSQSRTGSLYWRHAWSSGFGLFVMGAVEELASRAGEARLSGETSRIYLKAGLGLEVKL